MIGQTHAFVDESQRAGRYMLCAAVLTPADLASARNLMRSLRQPRQRRLHFKTESDTRRRTILAQLVVACEARVRIYISKAEDSVARACCLRQLTTDLIADDARRLVLESREGRDQADRQVIFGTLQACHKGADLTYEHMRPHEEPLLWIADAVGWAYGAGGDWRRRVQPLISGVTQVVARP